MACSNDHTITQIGIFIDAIQQNLHTISHNNLLSEYVKKKPYLATIISLLVWFFEDIQQNINRIYVLIPQSKHITFQYVDTITICLAQAKSSAIYVLKILSRFEHINHSGSKLLTISDNITTIITNINLIQINLDRNKLEPHECTFDEFPCLKSIFVSSTNEAVRSYIISLLTNTETKYKQGMNITHEVFVRLNQVFHNPEKKHAKRLESLPKFKHELLQHLKAVKNLRYYLGFIMSCLLIQSRDEPINDIKLELVYVAFQDSQKMEHELQSQFDQIVASIKNLCEILLS